MGWLVQVELGIVTGIVTSAILFLLRDLWRSRLRPFFEELRYSGTRIEGTWRGVSHDNQSHSEASLYLTQNASSVAGAFTFSFQNPERHFALEYLVTGYLWEGYLTLNFKPKDRALTTSAVALLKIAGGGHSLAGQFCFRNVDLEAVTAVPISLGRQTSALLPLVPVQAPPAAAEVVPPPEPPPA